MFNKSDIYILLAKVFDPEVPVLSILDLGIVRNLVIENDQVQIDISPTYSGCPAMDTIEKDIRQLLQENQIKNIRIQTVISPAWTTDWMSDEGKRKLEEYGIAPPSHTSFSKKVLLGTEQESLRCPRCKSKNTRLISQFGSTACKALHQCNDCLEPFDAFKCL